MSSQVKSLLVSVVVIAVAGSIILAVLFTTIFEDRTSGADSSAPDFADLGGVKLVFAVQVDQALRSRLERERGVLRSELRRADIPISRVKVTEGGDIEIHLLRSDYVTQAKKSIQRVSPDLTLRNEVPDGEGVRLSYAQDVHRSAEIKRGILEQARRTLSIRAEQFGVSAPVVELVGARNIEVKLPEVRDIEAAKRVLGAVAQLEFRFLPNAETRESQVYITDRTTGEPVAVEEEVQLTGDMVDRADVNVAAGVAEVQLALTTEGARQLQSVTTEGIGRQLAIILDGELYSAPEIREAISGGVASISGGFTMREAQELAIMLRAGALPAPLVLEQESFVEPRANR